MKKNSFSRTIVTVFTVLAVMAGFSLAEPARPGAAADGMAESAYFYFPVTAGEAPQFFPGDNSRHLFSRMGFRNSHGFSGSNNSEYALLASHFRMPSMYNAVNSLIFIVQKRTV